MQQNLTYKSGSAETSKFAKNAELKCLTSDINRLDIYKLETNPVNLIKVTNIVSCLKDCKW